MRDALVLWERPGRGKYLVAGWRQWADAGSVSSGLPQYLIRLTQARRIGAIRSSGFYLFQIPGSHHLLRPIVKLSEGHVESLRGARNEFFHAGIGTDGFFVFIGEEPHYNEHEYAGAFLDAVEELDIKRVVAVGGVYAPVPYEKDRDISCVYSLPEMRDALSEYALSLSNYEGGSTIGTYLAHAAEEREIEFVGMYAMVPAYDLSKPGVAVQALTVGRDYKAWYDLMVRITHMFGLDMDLADLVRRSGELISGWDTRMDELAKEMPELEVKSYLEKVRADFTERSYVPLSDVWEEGLRDILGEDEDDAGW